MQHKKIVCGYLYADGHAVIVWEKQDKDAGTIEYVEIHEKFTDANCSFQGRLTFGRYNQAMLDLAKRARCIRASEPSINHGSENTKRLNIAVGSLTFENGAFDGIHFNNMPGLISGSYTYQPNIVEECPKPDEMFWGNYRIARFHKVKEAKPKLSVIDAGKEMAQ